MHIKNIKSLIMGSIILLLLAVALSPLVIPWKDTYSAEPPLEYDPPQQRENFGSFSLSAAVRYPWNQSKMCPQCNTPTVMGVS